MSEYTMQEVERIRDVYETELAAIRAENERLREALREIASDDWNNAGWVRDFAKDALR